MGTMAPRKTPYTPKHAPPEQPLLFERHQVAHTDAKDFFPTPVPDGVRAIRGFCWDLVGATVLDPPAEYPQYGPGYYAVFFADPDGIKLECVYLPG